MTRPPLALVTPAPLIVPPDQVVRPLTLNVPLPPSVAAAHDERRGAGGAIEIVATADDLGRAGDRVALLPALKFVPAALIRLVAWSTSPATVTSEPALKLWLPSPANCSVVPG